MQQDIVGRLHAMLSICLQYSDKIKAAASSGIFAIDCLQYKVVNSLYLFNLSSQNELGCQIHDYIILVNP